MTVLLDANVFLRAIVKPPDPRIEWMHDEARTLFSRANRGEEQLTTPDAIIAEVAFVLTSKAHSAVAVDEACARMKPFLAIRNLRFHGKRHVLQALDLWPQHPRLDFPDVLLTVQTDRDGLTLASFDCGCNRFPTLSRYPRSSAPDDAGASGP